MYEHIATMITSGESRIRRIRMSVLAVARGDDASAQPAQLVISQRMRREHHRRGHKTIAKEVIGRPPR